MFKKQKGFDLIQLMIIIAIIGILAAVFLPMYHKHRQEVIVNEILPKVKVRLIAKNSDDADLDKLNFSHLASRESGIKSISYNSKLGKISVHMIQGRVFEYDFVLDTTE